MFTFLLTERKISWSLQYWFGKTLCNQLGPVTVGKFTINYAGLCIYAKHNNFLRAFVVKETAFCCWEREVGQTFLHSFNNHHLRLSLPDWCMFIHVVWTCNYSNSVGLPCLGENNPQTCLNISVCYKISSVENYLCFWNRSQYSTCKRTLTFPKS